MCEALDQRISELEDLLGLNNVDNSESLNFDVTPLKKRLQDIEAGFVMQVPVEKLYRLREAFIDRSTVSFKDKLRSVNFSSNLMEKRAELLEELQKSADMVLNSDRFNNVQDLMPELEKSNQEIKDGFAILSKFESELNTFYSELQSTIIALHLKLEKIEKVVRLIEDEKAQKLEKDLKQ